MFDAFARSFAAAMADVRQRVVERGWFGEVVTPKATTISLDTPEEQSSGDPLGRWLRSDQGHQPSKAHDHVFPSIDL